MVSRMGIYKEVEQLRAARWKIAGIGGGGRPCYAELFTFLLLKGQFSPATTVDTGTARQ